VAPKKDPDNENVLHPCVKLGVKIGSYMHQTELFGPVLGVMRAENLKEAFRIANSTPYGLTAGFHSLDTREHDLWIKKVNVGNYYINRTTTGAIVGRQPFGGCKDSQFGAGFKSGGPNYLVSLLTFQDAGVPVQRMKLPEQLTGFLKHFKSYHPKDEDHLSILKTSLESYAYWADHYSQTHPMMSIPGQDNQLSYSTRSDMGIVLSLPGQLSDVYRTLGVCKLIFFNGPVYVDGKDLKDIVTVIKKAFKLKIEIYDINALKESKVNSSLKHLRWIGPLADKAFQSDLASKGITINSEPILQEGKIELLHYFQEKSISYNYHRYGNLNLG